MHFCDHKKLLGPSGGLLKWYSQPIISMHINESARGKKNLTRQCHTCMGGNILLVESTISAILLMDLIISCDHNSDIVTKKNS